MELMEGNISVKAALEANRRTIFRILVDVHKKDKDTNYILQLAKNHAISIVKTSRENIDQIAQGTTHGGLIAECSERTYQSLSSHDTSPFYALLEGIEDPFNFGYILRSFYAFGCRTVFVPKRNWSTATTTVTKASAGASEHMNIIPMEEPEIFLQELKKQGIALIAADRKNATSIHQFQFPKRCCIAIGGEMRGLSSLVSNHCEANVFIPYEGAFKNALTATSSASIFAYELAKQKGQ